MTDHERNMARQAKARADSKRAAAKLKDQTTHFIQHRWLPSSIRKKALR